MSEHMYEQHLPRTAANFVALSPVSFVERSAEVFGDLPAAPAFQRIELDQFENHAASPFCFGRCATSM